jgi:hypothetical protein
MQHCAWMLKQAPQLSSPILVVHELAQRICDVFQPCFLAFADKPFTEQPSLHIRHLADVEIAEPERKVCRVRIDEVQALLLHRCRNQLNQVPNRLLAPVMRHLQDLDTEDLEVAEAEPSALRIKRGVQVHTTDIESDVHVVRHTCGIPHRIRSLREPAHTHICRHCMQRLKSVSGTVLAVFVCIWGVISFRP